MITIYKLLIIIGIVFVGYIGFQAVRFYVLLQHSKELVAKSSRFEQRKDGGSPRILVLGDSTAVGTGVNDPKGSTAGRFATDFPNADIWNFAVNGKRIGELATDFPKVPDQSFDLVLMQIGANDIIYGTDKAAFAKDLRTVFDRATKAGKHVISFHSGNIGLAPMFPWPVNRVLRSRTLEYREIYKAIAAEKGVIYIDLYTEAENDPLKGEGFYASDKLHLTEKGYGYWYEQIRKTMTDNNIRL